MCYEVLQKNSSCVCSCENTSGLEITFLVCQELRLVLAEVKLSCEKGIGCSLGLWVVWGKGSHIQRAAEVNSVSRANLHATGVG